MTAQGGITGDAALGERVREVLVPQFGSAMADDYVRVSEAHDAWERERRPDEGRRERSRRVTHQQIASVATALFAARGFDQTRVADIAALAGVSERTVHDHFPTKESIVFELADSASDRLLDALRERRPGESPTEVIVAALERDLDLFLAATAGGDPFLAVRAEMIFSHPGLRAGWRALRERFTSAVQRELAIAVEVDPRDPEPLIAARSIVGLQDVWFQSLRRRIESGLRDESLRTAIRSDLARAARLLDSGLASLELFPDGRRTRASEREAARGVEQARAQVRAAMHQARTAWAALRREQARKGVPAALAPTGAAVEAGARAARAATRPARVAAREASDAGRAAAREASGVGREAVRVAAREASGAGREAVRAARKTQRTLRAGAATGADTAASRPPGASGKDTPSARSGGATGRERTSPRPGGASGKDTASARSGGASARERTATGSGGPAGRDTLPEVVRKEQRKQRGPAARRRGAPDARG